MLLSIICCRTSTGTCYTVDNVEKARLIDDKVIYKTPCGSMKQLPYDDVLDVVDEYGEAVLLQGEFIGDDTECQSELINYVDPQELATLVDGVDDEDWSEEEFIEYLRDRGNEVA